MVHVAVNKYDFEKINILEYAFGEGGGGHQKAYAVYAFINVDNCERPLKARRFEHTLIDDVNSYVHFLCAYEYLLVV